MKLQPLFVARLSGRLSSGAQRGQGLRWHALQGERFNEWGRALCGARPGRLSGCGFIAAEDSNQPITCPRCLKAIGRKGDQQ